MFRIKICGITCRQDANAVVEAGADAIGFNFFPRSVRYISPREASQIAGQLPRRLVKVGVFVDASVGEIREIAFRVGLNWVQLHGDEPAEMLLKLRPLTCIKAFRVGRAGLEPVREFLQVCQQIGAVPSAILLDAAQDGEFGGVGKTFDWSIATAYSTVAPAPPPLVLSGGLNPENVATAISTVKPAAVDVASGVEESPGKKSAEKIKQFVAAAKGAWANLAAD